MAAVSADGSTFFDGLTVDNATGVVDQPRAVGGGVDPRGRLEECDPNHQAAKY